HDLSSPQSACRTRSPTCPLRRPSRLHRFRTLNPAASDSPTLSLHDALPILVPRRPAQGASGTGTTLTASLTPSPGEGGDLSQAPGNNAREAGPWDQRVA